MSPAGGGPVAAVGDGPGTAPGGGPVAAAGGGAALGPAAGRLFTAYLPPIRGWFTLAWMRRREYV